MTHNVVIIIFIQDLQVCLWCKRSPIDCDDDNAQRFPNSAYSCIPLQPQMGCVTQPTALVANECYHMVITINIPVSTAGREYMVMCYTGKHNSVREMWRGSKHRISFCDLSKATMVEPVLSPERRRFHSLTVLMFLHSTKIISKAAAYYFGLCIATENFRAINQRRCYPCHLRRSHVSILTTR